MNAYMNVSMYICVFDCMNAYIFVPHAYMYVCMYISMYVCMYACMYAFIYVRMSVWTQA